MHRSSTLLAGGSLIAWLLTAGCSRSCSADRPYVPYSIDAVASPAQLGSPASGGDGRASTVDAAASPSSSFSQVQAERPPEHAERIVVDNTTLTAPSGRVFGPFLKGDFDADAAADLLAWLQPTDGGGGELVWYSRIAGKPVPPVRVAAAPASLSGDAACRQAADLTLVGPRTAWLSVRSDCGPSVSGEGPSRWYAALMPARQPALRLEVQLDPTLKGETIELRADGSDRDGDQFDDVMVEVSLSGDVAPFPAQDPATVSAEIRYFDRPAGLSRDPHEPDGSFRNEVAKLARLARKKDAWRDVSRGVRRLRRLHQLMCSESEAPLLKVQGASLQCASSAALQEADSTELDAMLRSGELVAALGVLDRMERLGSTYDSRKLVDARMRVARALPVQEAQATPVTAPPSLGPPRAPSWGALAFDSDGVLLVRGSSSVTRFDPKSRSSQPASELEPAASTPWPSRVTSADGAMRFARVFDPCDGSPLRAAFEPVGGAGAGGREVPLPLESLVGRACAHYPAGPAASVRMLGYNGAELSAIVDGIPISVTGDLTSATRGLSLSSAPYQRGSARSPNGQFAVIPTTVGLAVVENSSKVTLWRVAGLTDAPERLRDCVVANQAAMVACIDHGGPTLIVAASTSP
jgi:hypothetical protein